MKHFYKIFALLFIATISWGCNDDTNYSMPPAEGTTATKSFATDDGASNIGNRTCGYKAYRLLKDAGPEVGKTLGYQNITDKEYEEIETFTNNLVATCTSDEEKYTTIAKWVHNNVTYSHANNDPYEVFKNRLGVCQGYANLLKVMLHTQDIPCVITNGMLNPYGGHAWNFVYVTNKWIASDPTNNISYSASSYSSNSQYEPWSIDAVLFEDEYCTYNYYEKQLNVCSIKEGHESVSIPYSAGGWIVGMLNPTVQVRWSVKELYIGANIQSFGDAYIGLKNLSTSIERIYVDPDSKYFESYSTGVYDKNKSGDNLVLVASGARHIELKPIEAFDKESQLRDLTFLETITFVPGTKNIGAWAVERCPSLHTVYVAPETTIEENAFTSVASDFKIVRGNYTNIPQIKY